MSNNNTNNWSTSTRLAIEHLQRIKPNDGWSIDIKTSTSLVRLLRRNIPVTDTYFLDIHYDAIGTRNVVGILTPPRQDSTTVQGQVLVDSSGKLLATTTNQRISIIPISGYTKEQQQRSLTRQSRGTHNERGCPRCVETEYCT